MNTFCLSLVQISAKGTICLTEVEIPTKLAKRQIGRYVHVFKVGIKNFAI